MKINSKRIKIVLSLIGMLSILVLFFYWQNNSIVITNSNYMNAKIPNDFDGFKIVHISDLHNKKFGENQYRLLSKIEKISPNIIVITGDLIDRRKFDLEEAMIFIKGAVKLAPVYYVPGNHEAWSNKYSTIRASLVDAGVKVLDNSKVELVSEQSKISILGLLDPDFLTSSYMEGTNTSELSAQLEKWSKDNSFKILLSHRPELLNLYSKNSMDLIFTGHAHGGQFRFPLIGGLIAPDQGFFPQYTSGSYTHNHSTMFVSRGLGNSIMPIRLFNRPEIVVVTLVANKNK